VFFGYELAKIADEVSVGDLLIGGDFMFRNEIDCVHVWDFSVSLEEWSGPIVRQF
jgi:hypothetical protein